MPTPVRARPSLRKRLALMLGAFVVALLGCEAALRVWGAVKGRPGPREFLQGDERLGWRNRPGYSGRHVTDDFAVAVCFGADGARCAAPGDVPMSGEGGVLAVGDSTTFGWGVEAGETFAAQLAGRLHVVVGNFGVSGYGADQELLLLRELLEHRAPRLVVVTHQDNDVTEVLRQWAYGRHKPTLTIDGEALQVVGSPVPSSWFAEHCELWRTLRKRWLPETEPASSADEVAHGRDLCRRIYGLMHRTCAAHGVGFLLVGNDVPWLQAAAAADGVAYCDLTATFARLRQAGPLSFAHDPHWLPRVHAGIAETLAATIAAQGLLAGRPDHGK